MLKKEGRYILIKGLLRRKLITIATLYFPKTFREWKVTFGREFNEVMNPALDRSRWS